jgi:hypothetical protein
VLRFWADRVEQVVLPFDTTEVARQLLAAPPAGNGARTGEVEPTEAVLEVGRVANTCASPATRGAARVAPLGLPGSGRGLTGHPRLTTSAELITVRLP